MAEIRLVVDAELVEVVDAGSPGIIGHGQQIVRLRAAPEAELSPENFDVDLEFEVDVTDVRESRGPLGRTGRPWGSLDKRLCSLIKAVDEYTSGLLAIAEQLVT